MTDYQKLKEIIQEANPEIMELKFGCEVKILYDDSDFYGKVKPEWYKLVISNVSPKKAVITVLNAPFPNNLLDVKELLDNRTMKILGRPIRLADILLTIINTSGKGWSWIDEAKEGLFSNYDLTQDNLDNQSEETKQYLINLLVK